jgi:hypothetical protein
LPPVAAVAPELTLSRHALLVLKADGDGLTLNRRPRRRDLERADAVQFNTTIQGDFMKRLIAYLAGAAALGVTGAYAAAPDAVTKAVEACCTVLAACCSGGGCC